MIPSVISINGCESIKDQYPFTALNLARKFPIQKFMYQIVCASCGKMLQIPEERLPLHVKVIKGRCPYCRKEISFANPHLNDDISVSQDPEVAVFPNIPLLVQKAAKRSFRLKTGINILGRSGDLSLPDDTFASRQHCTVEVNPLHTGYRLVLADGWNAGNSRQPSRNGTFLNGERLGPLDKMLLLPGDIIRVGRTELVVISRS